MHGVDMMMKMQGLRTQESSKFLEFFKMVQKRAKETEHIYFLDTGEGHELITDELDCEDLSGWLILNAKVKNFEKDFNDRKTDEWLDFYAFSIWDKKEDEYIIRFEIFDDNGTKIKVI